MMKTENLVNKINTTVRKTGFKLRKYSPEILVVAGIVGTVVSAVMACKATTKISDILETTRDDIDTIHNFKPDTESEETYSEEDMKKDLTIVYIQTGIKFVKLYTPAVLLGAVSIVSILTSNNILRKRNVAIAAAYATVDRGFKEYRNRVIERFGEKVDKELKYNIKAKKVDTISNEDGKEEKVDKVMDVIDPNTYSIYARFFDDGCTGWEKNAEYNLSFLRIQQQYANDLLRSRGHLFLNEVYDMLGIPRTKEGQAVGWIYDPDDDTRDNFVDFGIYDATREATRNFVNGYERTILLDFNVDGCIWDLI